jgi:hypothetical protein
MTSPGITARRVLAPVVAVAAIGGLPAPAAACSQASDCPFGACNTGTGMCQSSPYSGVSRQDGAAGFAITGFSLAGIGLLLLPFGTEGVHSKIIWRKVTWEVLLYGFGGLGTLFGGLGLGMQTTVSGSCSFKSECQVTYGLGGASLGIGAAMLAGGIYVSAAPASFFPQSRLTPTRATHWYAGLRPGPLVIPTVRGATVGVGISGLDL